MKIGGKEYKVRFTVKSIFNLEKELGESLLVTLGRLQNGAAIERKRNRQNPRQGKRICETGTTNSTLFIYQLLCNYRQTADTLNQNRELLNW